jgi:hypothetical protein
VDAPMPPQPQTAEPRAPNAGQPIQSSVGTRKPVQAISDQTLSPDTLSELNSIGGQ